MASNRRLRRKIKSSLTPLGCILKPLFASSAFDWLLFQLVDSWSCPCDVQCNRVTWATIDVRRGLAILLWLFLVLESTSPWVLRTSGFWSSYVALRRTLSTVNLKKTIFLVLATHIMFPWVIYKRGIGSPCRHRFMHSRASRWLDTSFPPRRDEYI